MTRRRFVPAAAAPLLAQSSPPAPNFVVAMTDDQGSRDLGCYGAGVPGNGPPLTPRQKTTADDLASRIQAWRQQVEAR